MHPSICSAARSAIHGRVPCDLYGDETIETNGGEENGCYAPGKQYLGTPPDKPKTSFTGLAITSSLAGVSFGIGVGSEDTRVDDVASTTNKIAVIYSAFQLRDYLCSSSPDEIQTQNPYHSIGFLQPLFLPGSSCVDISCFLTYAIPRQVSCLLLSICRLTIFGYFFRCTVAYVLHLNSTTICFVYQRSTHWCDQVITTAANRSVGLWPAPLSRSASSCWQSR